MPEPGQCNVSCSFCEKRPGFGMWLEEEKERKAKVLEMTPDNAWTYLDDVKLLAVLLSKDRPPKQKTLDVYTSVIAELRDAVNFVWADGGFASQFVGVIQLPAVVIVDPNTERHRTFNPFETYSATDAFNWTTVHSDEDWDKASAP